MHLNISRSLTEHYICLAQKKKPKTEHYICSTQKRKVIYNGRKKVDNSQVKEVKKRIPHHPHHGLHLF